MTTRASRGIGAVAVVLAVVGCAAQPGDPELPRAETVPGVERVVAPADTPVADTVAGVRAFGDTFGAAIAEDGRNTVFSPLSMAVAFAMLRAAASDETAVQLDTVFGFPTRRTHPAFNALTRDIVTTTPPTASPEPGDPPPPPVVTLANGLFVREDLHPSTEFLRTLAEQYGAAAQAVDFGSPTAERAVNAWVSKHTAGRIDRLFDRLDPNTITVLANAIYLKANWQTPFDPGATEDEPFHRADGSIVDAPMMRLHAAAELSYLSTETWQAVRLPYAGEQLAMWVLVPTTDTPTTPRFDAAALNALDRAEPRMVDLALPRWDFESGVGLLPVLQELGLTDVGDLPGIAPDAFVNDAVHRADITVDERGTEAAAVTGIGVVTSLPPPAELTVRADRPFAFAIVHEPTDTPLFLGTVADPTAR